jgi:SAM-dependent methyltransferase
LAEEKSTPIDWKVESQRFDNVAELYDIYRPSYPPELIDAILLHSGIQAGGKILEIGSGTGKATLLFAKRGYPMVCLEPGQNLIDVAAKNLAAYPNVRFVRNRFEEWEANQEKFDLVISAQAYHWVPEEVRYEITARAMKPHGYLAAFWNMYPGTEGVIRHEMDQVYLKYAPEISAPVTDIEHVIASRANSLREYPAFENVVVTRFPWSAIYDTRSYLGLLNTYSDHLRLSPQRRGILFEQIAELIDRHGGAIEKPYLAVVFMAQRTRE